MAHIRHTAGEQRADLAMSASEVANARLDTASGIAPASDRWRQRRCRLSQETNPSTPFRDFRHGTCK
jgi:hypothetical protein